MGTEQTENLSEASSSVSTYIEQYGLRIIFAIVLYFVFTKLIRVVLVYLENFLKERKLDPKVSEMIISITKYVLYLFLIVVLATFIGIDMAYIVILIIGIIAVIAFTMQNTLVNVGAGFVVAGLKLFKKGDYVVVGDIEGDVKKVEIYHTEILQSDNSVVFIPNSDVLNGIVTNTDKQRKRRVDVAVYVDFDNDVNKLRKMMLDVTKGDERILEDTEPRVIVRDLDKVSIKMRLSLWVKRDDYWAVLYDYNEKVIDAFQKGGVKFLDKNLANWPQD